MPSMFLFSTMRENSTRCPNKLSRPLSMGYSVAGVFLKKFASLASSPQFLGSGVAIHKRDVTLVQKAEQAGVKIMDRSDESVVGAPPLNVIFACLNDVSADYVMWVNPCLLFMPKSVYEEALAAFNLYQPRSMTAVRERRGWFWNNAGEPVNNLDEKNVSTQTAPPLYENCHAFHVFHRMEMLRYARYWNFIGPDDPSTFTVSGPERMFMDVDTQYDFDLLDAYLEKKQISFDSLLSEVVNG